MAIPEGNRITVEPPAILKCIHSDFRVVEVPLISPWTTNEGEYTHVWLDKGGWTTFDAEKTIGAFFDLPVQEVGSAGLKDEDGITRQLCSVRRRLTTKDLEAFNTCFQPGTSGSFLRLHSIEGHSHHPIRPRNLFGNSFRIVVRNLNVATAGKIWDSLKSNIHFSMANYYDLQRFGLPGHPPTNHLIGESLVQRDRQRAQRLIEEAGEHIIPKGNDLLEWLEKNHPKILGFYVDAFNSMRWNTLASLRFHATSSAGAPFRLGDLFDLWLPSDLSQCAVEPVLEYECHQWKPKENTPPIRRRRPAVITTNIFADPPMDDALHPGRVALPVSFMLPTGGYATMLMRQLLLRFGIHMRVNDGRNASFLG
ncbi:MAG: tRNA pseudouridine(13) synthase TruD [Magnetococcales bacterium]|nr:tRNA pseudouridine(13) synthase TruD [Magnetococcales bacterium]